MLFLVTADVRETSNVPQERLLGMLASTWEVIKQLETDGKVVVGGAFVGRRGGCVVADVDSHEELSDMLNRLPVSALLDWEAIPMIPAQSALDSAKWAMKQRAEQQRVAT